MAQPSNPDRPKSDPAPDLAAFISHATEDHGAAEAIAVAFERRGLKCWIAPRDVRPGRTYGGEIIRGIERSRAFILTLSRSSNASAFVAREVERAISKRRPIFTIRIEPVEPSPGLELFISDTQWIDAFGTDAHDFDRLAEMVAAAEDPEAPKPVAAGLTAPPPASRGAGGWLWGAGVAALIAVAGLAGFMFLGQGESLTQGEGAGDDTALAEASATASSPPADSSPTEAAAPAAVSGPPKLARLAEPDPGLPRPRAGTERCSRSGGTTYCASSVLAAAGGNEYGPHNLADGDDSTAWVEGKTGQGVGEFAVLEFDTPRTVRSITIRNGYDKSPDIYAKNSRAKDVELRFSSGDSLELTLQDRPGAQRIALSRPVEADWVALLIRSVYPGSKYADTAINEITLDAD